MKSIQASVIVPHRSNGPYRSLNRAFVWSWGNKMQKWIQEEYMHVQLYVSMLVAFPMKPQDPHLRSLIIALHIVKPSILRWGLLKVHSTRGGAVGCREWSVPNMTATQGRELILSHFPSPFSFTCSEAKWGVAIFFAKRRKELL